MEVGRIAVGLGFFGLAAYGFFAFSVTPEPVTLRDATLHPMGNGLVLVGQIGNTGGPDRLTGIGSDAASRAFLTARNIVVPESSTPTLAMDGAHGVLIGVHGDVSDGRLVPVTLWFEEAGRVSTRARVTVGAMDHSQAFDVPEGEPSPSLALAVTPDGKGWRVAVTTEQFSFSQEAADGPHVPGVGHGHLYLNGLKLRRLYGDSATIGALPPGDHVVRVTLNTNDHRAYRVDGEVVEVSVSLRVE